GASCERAARRAGVRAAGGGGGAGARGGRGLLSHGALAERLALRAGAAAARARGGNLGAARDGADPGGAGARAGRRSGGGGGGGRASRAVRHCVLTVLGQKGAGKTTYARWLLERTPRAVVVDRFLEYPGAVK